MKELERANSPDVLVGKMEGYEGAIIMERYTWGFRAIEFADEVSPADVTSDNILTATLVQLPFHLRTGPLLRVSDPETDQVEIWLRNEVSIATDAELALEVSKLVSDCTYYSEKVRTEALIIDRKPVLRANDLEFIKTGNANQLKHPTYQQPGFR